MTLFEANKSCLKTHHPGLAERLERLQAVGAVQVCKARDGGVYYAVEQGGRAIPVTDPLSPTARLQAQLNRHSHQLQDFTRPILIIGLYPGNELLYLHDLSENVTTPHCPQPIWVCVDSILCLSGFLQSWDARRVLESKRVRWFWHEELPSQVEELRRRPEFPHVFTLISSAPEKTLDSILPPIAKLVEEREAELDRLKAANEAYYDELGDEALSAIQEGRGGRKPRLLMPTCMWSTFIRHSTRDTCEAFNRLGWETRILNAEAMITPYCLAWTIHDFRPDVLIFIDHLRSEAEEVYPRNLMFVTWVQDEMAAILDEAAGDKMRDYAARGRRDLVAGHVGRLESEFGYPADRLVPMIIPANPQLFHPVSLSKDERRRYGCDLAFMSNVSQPSEQVLETHVAPLAAPVGLTRAICVRIHDDLWRLYRTGRTLAGRQEFLDWLLACGDFAEAHARLQSGGAPPDSVVRSPEDLVRLFYWRMNDTIYRHVVLEWADEMGLALNLYGHGWDRHPRFAKYARGILPHGPELNNAYQAAGLNLHLNITHGMHQRLWEIKAAGARLLMRVSQPFVNPVPVEALRELAARMLDGEDLPSASSPRGAAIREYVLNIALSVAGRRDSSAPLEQQVAAALEAQVLARPDWIIPDFDRYMFHDKDGFKERVTALLDAKPFAPPFNCGQNSGYASPERQLR